MKYVIILMMLLIGFTVFAVKVIDTPNKILYLLNWGEYINHDVVEKFEEEYNCQVVEEIVVSSEAMYQKIAAQTSSYDVAIPGDYIVYQLYHENLLKEIDVNNEAYSYLNNYNTIFTDSLQKIINENMIDSETGEVFNSYFMPYFWGAYSIIYNETKEDVGDVVRNYGFEALYNRSLYKETVKIGMYDTARWIVASYLMSKNLNPNITSYDLDDGKVIKTGDLSTAIQNDVINILKTNKFDEFNNDQLKRNVANGQLDLCYTQLGDFFNTLYLIYDQGDEAVEGFNVCVPNTTAAFFDSMIIPKTTQNYELANQFINFMLNPENAYPNAIDIGYCPTLKEVCNLYIKDAEAGAYYYGDENSKSSLTLKDFLTNYPVFLDPLCNSNNVYILESKSNKYLTTCETIFNNLS